jgi:poly-gamma-glutamate capsule biosynthesis protein CapA/YwtB (metallophosphatase superfamily)
VRSLLLALRAGAVVAAVGVVAALVVDGAPEPVASTKPARTTAEPTKQSTSAAEPPKPRRAVPAGVVSISAVGDIVMGSTPNLPPNGGQGFFDRVKPDLAADIVLGNLEGTLTDETGSKCGRGSVNCFSFRTPPGYARWLDHAGFTVLNLANNHAFDFGARGLADTVAALDRHGLLHTGRPGEIVVQRVGAIRVALVGFSTYRWSNRLTDLAAVRRLVRRADARADVVVVTAHMGAEGTERQHVKRGNEVFLGENRGDPIRFAHAAVDAGADLVVGHGPHVMRGMEWYRGRLIAYSLGNFAGYKVFALGGPLSVSGILRVTLAGDGSFEAGVLVASQLIGKGVPALDPAGRAHGIVRELSRADFGPHAVTISSSGTLAR